MDEKNFENRLERLKTSYDQLPTVSNATTIMKKIKENEQPLKKKSRIHLPYVASFIAVLLIGGILSAQLIQENFQGNNEQVTQEVIDDYSNKLNEIYQQKIDELKQKINFEKIESLSFVIEAKTSLGNFKNASPNIYAGEKNLKVRFEETKEFIERRLMIPSDEIDYILTKGTDNPLSDEEILAFLQKQEELIPIYNENLLSFYEDYQTTIKKLPYGDITNQLLELDDKEMSEFIEKSIWKNGYIINHVPDGVEIEINYLMVTNKGMPILSNISNTIKDYLEIMSKKSIEYNATLTISWDELSDQIIEIENFIINNPDFPKNEELILLFYQYLHYYLSYNYLENSPIYDDNMKLIPDVQKSYHRFIEKYGESETGTMLKPYYLELEKNDFIRPDLSLEYPQLVQIQNSEYEIESIYNEPIALTEELINVYLEYKETNQDQVLSGLRPYDVMRIYMYASENNDPETVYALYNNGDISLLPTKDMFMKTWNSQMDLSIYKNVENVDQIYLNENEVNIKMDIVHLDDNSVPNSFVLQKVNGIWKVKWQPLQ